MEYFKKSKKEINLKLKISKIQTENSKRSISDWISGRENRISNLKDKVEEMKLS